jgi:cyclase
MPLAVGGCLASLADIEAVLAVGVEKVCVGTRAHQDPSLLTEAAKRFGSQSVIAALDCRAEASGHRVYSHRGVERTDLTATVASKRLQDAGAGELIVTSIERDGTRQGYDLSLLQCVTASVRIPVIASGGAASVDDFIAAIECGASAVAAGAMFVFKGALDAVLINVPDLTRLQSRDSAP